MRIKTRILCALLCLCLLTGCTAAPAPQPNEETTVPTTEVTVPETAGETVPETTEETVPETTEETVPETTGETEPAGTDNPVDPVLEAPVVEADVSGFFEDSVFLGDSISYSLMVHNMKTKDLGNALFLTRKSQSVHNIMSGVFGVTYQGKEMTPWEAFTASGAKKAFIMLGTNDIGYYGIEDTMIQWELFLQEIRNACPDLEIYIQAQLPMWNASQQVLLSNANIDKYNQLLQEFAEANGCRFINAAPYLKNGSNGLAQVYSGDNYVHINEKGTAVWAAVLKAYAEEQENS